MSIDDYILDRFSRKKRGIIFSINNFSDLGKAEAVRVALHRLVKKGLIQRVARGLYVKPQISKLLNKEVMPDLDKVAKAIAKRDKARIIPTGSFALNALGLSTQIPLKIVYYTDGKARKVKIGKHTITFKKTSPKKLSFKGKISKLAILAMSEIGKGKLTENEKSKIIALLKRESIADLKHDLNIAPQWIAEIINDGIKK